MIPPVVVADDDGEMIDPRLSPCGMHAPEDKGTLPEGSVSADPVGRSLSNNGDLHELLVRLLPAGADRWKRDDGTAVLRLAHAIGRWYQRIRFALAFHGDVRRRDPSFANSASTASARRTERFKL